MLAEAKREAERIVKEARERQDQLVSQEEVVKQAERVRGRHHRGRPRPRARDPARRRGLRRRDPQHARGQPLEVHRRRPARPRAPAGQGRAGRGRPLSPADRHPRRVLPRRRGLRHRGARPAAASRSRWSAPATATSWPPPICASTSASATTRPPATSTTTSASSTGARANGVGYASFGLIWREFGERICAGDQEVADAVDGSLVQPVDANDTGQQLTQPVIEGVRPMTVNGVIGGFNARWDEDADADARSARASTRRSSWRAASSSARSRSAAAGRRAAQIVRDAIAAAEDPRRRRAAGQRRRGSRSSCPTRPRRSSSSTRSARASGSRRSRASSARSRTGATCRPRGPAWRATSWRRDRRRGRALLPRQALPRRRARRARASSASPRSPSPADRRSGQEPAQHLLSSRSGSVDRAGPRGARARVRLRARPGRAGECGEQACGTARCLRTASFVRPARTRSHAVYCEGLVGARLISAPPHTTITDIRVDGYGLFFTTATQAGAPAIEEARFALEGTEHELEWSLPIQAIPPSENEPPVCEPASVRKRSDGAAPVPVIFSVSCSDPEADEFTLTGSGPGTHSISPNLVHYGAFGAEWPTARPQPPERRRRRSPRSTNWALARTRRR